MKAEYTTKNKEKIQEKVHLHDTMITKVVWDYQDRSLSFELTNWEWHKEGRLSFQGAVYMEGSALGLWGSDVTGSIYVDCLFVDPDCSVSDVFAQCVEKSKSLLEDCTLPDPDDYFCMVFGTRTGDQLRFIVKKMVWESDD